MRCYQRSIGSCDECFHGPTINVSTLFYFSHEVNKIVRDITMWCIGKFKGHIPLNCDNKEERKTHKSLYQERRATTVIGKNPETHTVARDPWKNRQRLPITKYI